MANSERGEQNISSPGLGSSLGQAQATQVNFGIALWGESVLSQLLISREKGAAVQRK